MSIPNIILKGHKAQPTYALDWGIEKAIIASGCQNGEILVWNLDNHLSSLKGVLSKPVSRDELIDSFQNPNKKTRSSKMIKKSDQKKGAEMGDVWRGDRKEMS